MTFEDLELDPNVLRAVLDSGYATPTPIQAQAIPHALKGRDVLGIAQTGTGKTASFVLPMLTLLDRGVDVLIATPGRLLDHFERGRLMLTGIEIMVVDEADRMLDMGFIPDIERIFKLTDKLKRQTLFFSATMPPEITRLTEEFLHNPVRVEAAPPSTTAATVEQRLCRFRPSKKENADSEKRDLLRDLLRAEGEALRNAIIFCNRKRDIGAVFKSLQRTGLPAGALHGDLDQSVRMATLDGFRDGAIKLLVASDVAARGLDIPNVSHVINYDVPIHSEDYVHRIGRTGRAGRSGRAITIALPSDEKHVEKIEKLIEKSIETMEPPGGHRAPPAADAAGPDAAARTPAAPREGGRRDRRRGPERREPAAAPEAQEAAPAPVARTSPPPARREPPRAEPAGREPAPRDEARREAGRRDEPRRDGGRREGGRREDPVVGLGDHVPAFLMREIPVRKTRARDEDADEAA